MKPNNKHELQKHVEMLNDQDLEIRLKAIRTLAVIGDRTIIKKFLDLLSRYDPINGSVDYAINTEVIFNLQFLLNKFPDQTAENKIIEILGDETEENNSYRALCAEVLGYMKLKRAVPILINLLDVVPARVQESIAFALGRIGDEKALPALYKLINDATDQVTKTSVVEEANKAIKAIKDE